jgi:type IV pilus assembly protein PilY1
VPAGTQACQYTSTQNLGPQWLTDTQCKNMVLDFTFGQSFSGPADFAYTNRNGSCAVGDAKPCPFGGVFHATPVDVGPPGSLLHDDSYDAFRATGAATREEMVYVATTDGLLHAFGQPGLTVANNERWSMLLPAVMPNLLSSFPAADKFLLDGRPIVKDVVWDRTQGTVGAGTAWHTTLVASFGPQQLGYYALDVTNPAFNSMPSGEPSTGPTGPVFLWQLTKMPSTNQALFGPGGATPAITTVFANVDNTVPHEIGVAILPGGGLLSPPKTPAGNAAGCTRDIVQRNLGSAGEATVPSTASPSYKYRSAVRCWGGTGAYADPVAGRSVSVVRIDTGEVLRVFMRKADTSALPNDTLLNANPTRIIDTPLDSPMTGTPAVYPSDVGADATKFFIADQDGTIWKFDLSDPNPSNWTGKLFLDLYNQTADTSSTAWNEAEPVSVPLVSSLDPAGEVVVHAATGSLDQFDTSGLNFVYSITEKVQTQGSVSSLRASVNWYMDSASGTTAMDPGERVAGPMTVFDGTLYYMTFDAYTAASSCSPGWAKLYGRDYIMANPTTGAPSAGGVNHLSSTLAPNGLWARADALPHDPGVSLQGKVIPGVAVQQTTACVSVGTAASDQYVPGAMHATPSSMTAGTYSLVAQVGTANPTNGQTVETVKLALPTPIEPTVINSWAAVTE